MSKAFRPEGWVNPYPDLIRNGREYGDARVFEDGADAMLEGLRKDPMVLLHICHKGDAEVQRLVEDYYKEW